MIDKRVLCLPPVTSSPLSLALALQSKHPSRPMHEGDSVQRTMTDDDGR
jgi:hypothetical protein